MTGTVLPAHAQYYMLHLSHMQSTFEISNNCLYYQVITSCLKGISFFAKVTCILSQSFANAHNYSSQDFAIFVI